MKKWAFGIKGKVKIAAVLCGVLSLLLWNNLMDRKRINQLQSSFSSIYEDRLMVESFIFELSSVLHEREQLIDGFISDGVNAQSKAHLQALDKRMEGLIKDYSLTQFTDLEASVFEEFRLLLPAIYQLGSHRDFEVSGLAKQNRTLTNKALANLSVLSNIQTSEGQRLIEESNGIMLQKKSSAQFEIISLIALAIIIQVLLFSSASLLEKIHHKPHLN